MDYAGLITRAFRITLKYKFLWFLGILASLTSGGANITAYNFNLPDFSPYLRQQQTPSPKIEPEGAKVLGAQVGDWISTHLYLILGLSVLFLFFIILLYVISTMAKGGLIASVFKIEKNESVSFKIGFKDGYHAFWRIFGIQILIGLFIFIVLAFLGLPIVFLIFTQNHWLALGLGFLFLPILILFLIYLEILSMYAIRFTVCQGSGVRESIKMTHSLMMKFKKEILFVWLISVGIGLAIALALGLLSLLIFFPLIALGLGIYAGVGLGLILFLGFLLLSGIIQTFQSSFWTLAFLGLSEGKGTVDKS